MQKPTEYKLGKRRAASSLRGMPHTGHALSLRLPATSLPPSHCSLLLW